MGIEAKASNKNEIVGFVRDGSRAKNCIVLFWSKLRVLLLRFEYYAPTSSHDAAKRTKERAAATS